MLETANALENTSGLSSQLRKRDSGASAPDSSEQNRRFGLAALAASRRTAEPGETRLSRGTINIPPVGTPAESDLSESPSAAESTAGSSSQFIAPLPPEPASTPAAPSLPPVEEVREAARANRVQKGLAAIAASRRAAAAVASQVQNGQSLSALSGTSTGVQQFSSGLLQSDGGRSSTSLFDLPTSGQGLVNRLRAQVRPSSPLNALRSRDSIGTSPLTGVLGGLSTPTSLTGLNSQRASLRSTFLSNDNDSRRLLSISSPNRTSDGFGLSAVTSSALDLIG
jgi:hypothetical protein